MTESYSYFFGQKSSLALPLHKFHLRLCLSVGTLLRQFASELAFRVGTSNVSIDNLLIGALLRPCRLSTGTLHDSVVISRRSAWNVALTHSPVIFNLWFVQHETLLWHFLLKPR